MPGVPFLRGGNLEPKTCPRDQVLVVGARDSSLKLFAHMVLKIE